jgi:hypothetical protein
MSPWLASVRRVAIAGSVVFGLMLLAHGLVSLGRNWSDPSYWGTMLGFFALWMLLGTLMVRVHPRPPTFAELLQAGLGAAWLGFLIGSGLTLLLGLLSVFNGWDLLRQGSYWYGIGQLYLLSVGVLALLFWALPFRGRWKGEDAPPERPDGSDTGRINSGS